jgi:hypothetical protein
MRLRHLQCLGHIQNDRRTATGRVIYFVVEGGQKTYRVNLEKLLTYLDRGKKSAGRWDDAPHKKRLRRLKDGDIWGPLEEKEQVLLAVYRGRTALEYSDYLIASRFTARLNSQ